MKRLLSMLLLCVWLASAIPAAADLTIGLPADPGNGNCFPFGCAYTGEYQQVYTKSQFSGPITITNLEFFNTEANTGATAMNSGNWVISLSTTSADWNTLSSTFNSNIGADNTQVFSGDLSQPWSFPKTLVINLSTPFTYDPSLGNLLMDVIATGTTETNGGIFFDANGIPTPNTVMGRLYIKKNVTHDITVDNGYGLVTEFSTGPQSIPEPATMLLFGFGLVGLVGVRRFK